MVRIVSAAALAGFAACAVAFAQDEPLSCPGMGSVYLHLQDGPVCLHNPFFATRFPWEEAPAVDPGLALRLADPADFLRLTAAIRPPEPEETTAGIAAERFGPRGGDPVSPGIAALSQFLSQKAKDGARGDPTRVGGIAYVGSQPADPAK